MESERKVEVGEKRGVRLVLFTLPLQGHINPMLQLATILHSRGFSITFVHTHFNSPNSSNYPHFTFIPISDGLSDAQASMEDVVALSAALNVSCVEPFRERLARLLSDQSEEPIACLISDVIMHFTQSVADSLKLPRIVLRTSGVSAFRAFAAFPILRQKGFIPIAADAELEAPLPDLPPLRVKDIPVVDTQNAETLYELMDKSTNQAKSSSGIIWNSLEHLEHESLTALRQELGIPMYPIGPFQKYCSSSSSSLLAQDRSCIAWLDKQAPKSVIYVSYGSIAAMTETEFVEVAWGLANSNCPFLWVVRPGSVRGSEWIDALPHDFLETVSGRGCIVKWAPQDEVLAHPAVGGFWTHNGWNSTLESICEGVPMLCRPYFGDQRVNARYVSDVWRVGVQLENELERGAIESGIRRLMVGKVGEEMRMRALKLKEQVDLSLEKGGSSDQSLEALIAFLSSF
ncbi:PREDICTED: UDP-glycosyltransferase 76F1-like [Nelumbo nucifera]|uniref:UDP-glycosyltransferase 76F1-like n=2 Tax=Nelumbo nucifera TaxID=4432 RepID=A0A1U8AB68_NELNU|nr:PREDICTED: UDP-glycosyltransferase 76F1-like [Nelumbo nucifera]XP_010264017.1 PREDICTED: UDP-glycosyltransferase 76F1-like [Nelumbo nucifera]XP_010264018.1 PREDICTED: UDP-glycosyltransferase 76F1-like [Nelumbo nucifera]XP_019054128.1 PREDICTED: UDP-glycosyltransferase 76F1-like [Nelumbo nucifera]DAD36949.1 TPA_asm: hypothetical protein HUJ06_007590 [Nelumbo nucifera]